MISREIAEKLKNAGLVWEPKKGDWGYNEKWENKQPALIRYDSSNSKVGPAFDDVWLPRLDQLLAEIEARDWDMMLTRSGAVQGYYRCKVDSATAGAVFGSAVMEDAAAKALLWILEQKGA